MAKEEYLSGLTLRAELASIIEQTNSRLLLIDNSEALLWDYQARLEGDDRLNTNTNSNREHKGLLTCEENAIPFHASRVTAFLKIVELRLKSGSLTRNAIDLHFTIDAIHDLTKEIVCFADYKKEAMAKLVCLKQHSQDGNVRQAIENLEIAHDAFVHAGNEMNAWIRDNKAVAPEHKTPQPPRKFLSAPAVLDAISELESALTGSEKPIIERGEALGIAKQFTSAIKAQIVADIRKSLPKDFSVEKYVCDSIIAKYNSLSRHTHASEILSDNKTDSTIRDLSTRLKAYKIPALSEVIEALTALETSKGR